MKNELLYDIQLCLTDSNSVIDGLLNILESKGMTLEDLELGSSIDISGTLVRNEQSISVIDNAFPNPNSNERKGT